MPAVNRPLALGGVLPRTPIPRIPCSWLLDLSAVNCRSRANIRPQSGGPACTAQLWTHMLECRLLGDQFDSSNDSDGSTAGLGASDPLSQDLSFALARRTADVRVHPQS